MKGDMRGMFFKVVSTADPSIGHPCEDVVVWQVYCGACNGMTWAGDIEEFYRNFTPKK